MKRLSHLVWLVRWLQRLGSAVLRRRKLLDLLPSVLSRSGRLVYDRRTGRLHGFRVRPQLSDYWAYDQCLATSALDLDRFSQGATLKARYAEMVARGRIPVILDCGANIGFSAFWLGSEFPAARVIAVEPDAENVRLAAYNTRACPNVTLLQGAVASADCRLALTHTDKGADAFRTELDATGEVKGYAIATLVAQAGASLDDLLLAKIDIEGFERELFSANTDWVQHAQAIVIETHDWMLPGQATAHALLQAISRSPRDFLIDGEHILSFRL